MDETRRAGEARISQWWRLASGRELGGADVYQLRADGWAGKPVSQTDPVVLQQVRERIVADAEKATGGRVEIGSFDFEWSTMTARVNESRDIALISSRAVGP